MNKAIKDYLTVQNEHIDNPKMLDEKLAITISIVGERLMYVCMYVKFI